MDKKWDDLKLEAKEIYALARIIDPTELIRAIGHADSAEERRFYAYVSDMNMQRVQKEVIRKNLF